MDNLSDFICESSSRTEEYDQQQEIARSSFADMLHDTERNQKYYDALKLAINKVHSLGKKAKVLDIGTGSGLLSMMAVNCGADSVIACEAFSPISERAELVIKLNGFTDKIKLVHKHSTDLTVGEIGDLPEKANILVAEVFDTELIGEGAIPTFFHAYSNLLEEDCIVIPSFGTVYAQVVESKLAQNWNKINDIYDDNGMPLLTTPLSIKNCPGSVAVHDIQLSQFPINAFKQICAPQPVFCFDWSGKKPLQFKEEVVSKIVAECDGKAQAIFMWWELSMDPDNTVLLSCAPYWAHPLKKSNPDLTNADIPWRDHWLQAIYYLPVEIPVTTGQELNLISCHDKFSLWFYLESQLKLRKWYSTPVCQCSLHVAHSRARIGKINDDLRRTKYLSLFKKHINKNSVVLVFGSGFYFALVAARLGAKRVIIIEENVLSARIVRDFTTHNALTNVVIVSHIECLPDTKEITLIVAEPHFNHSILPWDNVSFARTIESVKKYMKPDVIILPKECLIKGIMVDFENLHKIHIPVEACGEFDMKPFDDAIKLAKIHCDPVIDAQPLWEYPCKARSAPATLARLNMFDIHSSPLTSFSGALVTPGSDKIQYNAIAMWAEWDMDGTEEHKITTGPVVPPVIGEYIQWDMYTKQGVYFVQPKSASQFYCKFDFDTMTYCSELGFC